jgi:hypothetical protein
MVLPGPARPPAGPARGVAAVGGNNRVEPDDAADASKDGADQ